MLYLHSQIVYKNSFLPDKIAHALVIFIMLVSSSFPSPTHWVYTATYDKNLFMIKEQNTNKAITKTAIAT